MSHFSTFVLLPKDTDPELVEDKITDLLAPFDENESVEPYQDECHCLDHNLIMAVREKMDKELGTFDESVRAPFNVKMKKLGIEDHEERDRLWKEALEPYNKREAEVKEELKAMRKPTPDCEDCKGTGTYERTYNPKSKWDWWVIGGRWTGQFEIDYDPAKDEKNLEVCRLCEGTGMRNDDVGLKARQDDPKFKCNGCDGTGKAVKFPTQWANIGNVTAAGWLLSLPVEQFDKVGVPFALVTPDGQWNERGEMGWFGCVRDEKEKAEWAEQVRKIYEAYPDHIVVCCDLHI